MKKVLYSSLMALMMLFAFGKANADNAKVKVVLNPTTWTIGTTAPQFTVTITPASTEEGGDESAATDESDALTLGTAEGNVAVKVTLTNGGTTKEQVITASPVALTTTDLTAGTWNLTYALVKGDATTDNFDGAAEMDNASTSSLTVAAAPVVKPNKPTFNPRTSSVVDANAKVTISTTTSGATIRYQKGDAEWADYTAPVVITEDVTLKACAIKDEVSSDTVTASYTIAVLPADEEGAPALTFTPDNTAEVDNNTEIFVTGAPAGYTMEYAVYATASAALKGYYGDIYGTEGYPTVTATEPIVKIILSDGVDNEFTYYRKYQVKPASDVDMPEIMSENIFAQAFHLYPKGDTIKIVAEEADAIWYTTDGSKPAIDGANATKIEGTEGIYVLNTSATLKVIAVKDGKASDVQTARFTLIEDATVTLSLSRGMGLVDSIVGKNSPLYAEIDVVENRAIGYTFPYTLYYTTDGVTIPSAEAYEQQGANGAIKKSETVMKTQYGETYMDVKPFVLISKTEATTVNAIAYTEIEMEDFKTTIVSQMLTYTIDSIASGLKDPEFNLASGEVRIGDTLRIKNLNLYTEEELEARADKQIMPPMIYFSLDGTLPASIESTYHSSNNEFEDEVLVIFQENEKGTYAFIPANESYYDGSDTVYFEGELSIQAICYDYVEYGEGTMFMPGMLEYGSDFVGATYMVMKDFAMPVIAPEGGMVRKGTEVTISAGDGLDIYYTTNDSVPVKDSVSYTKKYEAPIVVNEAMTIKAIAFKAGAEGDRDSVSNVAVAVFTLIPDTVAVPTFSVEEGEVEAGTQVALACATEDAKIYYTVNGDEPTAESTEYTTEITIEKTMTIKAIAMKEGMVASKVVSATYTVEEDTVYAPVFSLKGEVAEGDTLKITCATEDAEIFYALDEAEFVKYEQGIVITKDVTVKAYAKKGEKVSDTVTVSLTIKSVANEGQELAGVNVYPNPSNGTFNVAVPERARIDIFGMNGAKVMSREANAGVESFNINNSGIYFVRVMAGNKTAVKRVVVR